MKHLVFRIIQQKPVELDLSLKFMQTFPVHEHYFIEGKETMFIYKYNPTRKMEETIEQFKEAMCRQLKSKYNAYSVTCIGELQNQIEQKK